MARLLFSVYMIELWRAKLTSRGTTWCPLYGTGYFIRLPLIAFLHYRINKRIASLFSLPLSLSLSDFCFVGKHQNQPLL